MDQENNDQNPKSPEKEAREKANDNRIAKLEAIRAVKKLSNGDSQWTITQELLQEIQAAHVVANPDVTPQVTKMVEELKQEIEKRYVDDPELRELLLESVPAVRSVREWLKKDGWEEAVWGKVRQDGLFTPAKRAQVIESLRTRALDKSDVAAKIWLTLSGDYSEKMEVDNRSVDMYREINQVLHNKNKK